MYLELCVLLSDHVSKHAIPAKSINPHYYSIQAITMEMNLNLTSKPYVIASNCCTGTPKQMYHAIHSKREKLRDYAPPNRF